MDANRRTSSLETRKRGGLIQTAARAALVARDGRVHTMNLADLENAGDVRRALETVRQRMDDSRRTPDAAAQAALPDAPAGG